MGQSGDTKKTVVIVAIIVLFIIAICMAVLIAVTPDKVEEPKDIHAPNELIENLNIARNNVGFERMISIRTYQGEPDFNDMLAISLTGRLEYYELDKQSNDYLLITPFEINGIMELSNVVKSEQMDGFETKEAVFKCNSGQPLPENYALLLRYSRPDEPEYEIKLTQTDYPSGEKQTATYRIVNMESSMKFVEDDGEFVERRVKSPVKKDQRVKDNKDAGTESEGDEIIIEGFNDKDTTDEEQLPGSATPSPLEE